MDRFLGIFFFYVAVFLLLFAAAARAGEPQQETTAAATSTDASLSQEPVRRALPAPHDGVFPGTDYPGPTLLIGVPDTEPVYPLTKAFQVAPRIDPFAKVEVQISCILSLTLASNLRRVD